VEVHKEEERARNMNLNGGRTGGVDLDGGCVGGVDLDGRRGTDVEAGSAASWRTHRRSGR
jgi:hypothetical protein